MSNATYLVGDVFERMAEMPDGSVDLLMTSPPFLALRSYLPADHPDKAKEIGSEPTPAAFIDTLLDLTVEWRRLLAPHGSIVVELGDTYAGSGGAGGDYNEGGLREDAPKFTGSALSYRKAAQRNRNQIGWPLPKSLACIPDLYKASLAYGRNLLTGREIEPWRVRNEVRWCRPNPPVGALGDKFRPATSSLTIACMSASRYFDLDAVRTVSDYQDDPRHLRPDHKLNGRGDRPGGLRNSGPNPAGAPPLDYWVIPTAPYKGSHYATYPPELCRIPILAMCPQKVCRECGEPSRRIVGDAEYVNAKTGALVDKVEWQDGELQRQGAIGRDNGSLRSAETLGWTDCEHDDWRPGLVLDPFAGSGTTLAVATGLGRDAIGIDLDERNLDLARERVGMFLVEDEPTIVDVAL